MRKQVKINDTVQVVKEGDWFNGRVGKVTDHHVGDGKNLWCVRFGTGAGECEWYASTELAPVAAPATPPVEVSKRNSYDDDDVDDMIGALLKIAETLNLEHVSATQIAEGVATLQAENARLRAALADLLAMFKQSGDPDQTDIIEVWRDSPGQVSLTREMQAKVDAVRKAQQAQADAGE